ncbi:ankyrin repeat-containing domain protein [Nemania sp. FL0916]|nr:ankyrin repeat-containing domain protein [Nemania sp. FL0916]
MPHDDTHLNQVYGRGNDGQTPLHFAARNKNAEFATILLEDNANVLVRDNNKRTPIHVAAQNQDLALLQMLLERCSAAQEEYTTLNQTRYGKSPHPMYSYRFHSQEAPAPDVSYLDYDIVSDDKFKNEYYVPYTRWLAPNIPDIAGQTALHLATRASENDRVVQCLLDNGADVNAMDAQGRTALHFAVIDNKPCEVISRLLSYSPIVDMKDIYGKTAVNYWSRDKGIEMLLQLSSANAVFKVLETQKQLLP